MELSAVFLDRYTAAAMGGLRARNKAQSIDLVESEPRARLMALLIRFGVGESLVRGPFMLELQETYKYMM
jgi:hypothetical protein